MNAMRQFELMEDLRPGGSAKAILLKWNGQRYVVTNEQTTVFEFVGTHGHRGDRGYACYSPESERWEATSGLFEQVAGWLPA
jgi:hypothetical protein